MGDTSERIVAIILNWNSYDDTAECLRSIQTINYEPFEVIVVDNGSTDGSGQRLDMDFPNVSVIFNEENKGFSGGVNSGFREAEKRGAEYILMLNNDVVVDDPTILQELVETMRSKDRVGVVSPVILHHDDHSRVWFRSGFLHSNTAMAGHEWYEDTSNLILKRLLGTNPQPLRTKISEKNTIPNDYIPFCFALINKNVLNMVGYYPSEYFIYYGDVDYSYQISNVEFKLLTRTDLEVYHRVTASSGGDKGPLVSYYNARNRWLFARKLGIDQSDRFLSSYLIWMITRAADRIFSGNIKSAFALCQGVVDGIRGQSGRGKYP